MVVMVMQQLLLLLLLKPTNIGLMMVLNRGPTPLDFVVRVWQPWHCRRVGLVREM